MSGQGELTEDERTRIKNAMWWHDQEHVLSTIEKVVDARVSAAVEQAEARAIEMEARLRGCRAAREHALKPFRELAERWDAEAHEAARWGRLAANHFDASARELRALIEEAEA